MEAGPFPHCQPFPLCLPSGLRQTQLTLPACPAPQAPDKEPLLALLWAVLVYRRSPEVPGLACPCRPLPSPGAKPPPGARSLLLEAWPVREDTVSQVLGLNSTLFVLSLLILSLYQVSYQTENESAPICSASLVESDRPCVPLAVLCIAVLCRVVKTLRLEQGHKPPKACCLNLPHGFCTSHWTGICLDKLHCEFHE